jgi:CRP/FNR family transcriptional regulator, polysaccharide utilization system transcription regulator
MMPELDGYGTLNILSKNAKTAGIPFIYLTAKAEKDDFRKGMSLGADDYITKPFDDVMLLQTIEAKLRKYDRLKAASGQPGISTLEHFINEAKASESIQALSENREIRHFRKKDPIFDEGETPRWLFQVEKGKVKIFKTAEDGRELILRIAGPGEFVGYLALLQDAPYTEGATALEDAEVRLVPKSDFQTLVYGNRDVMARFIKMLASHIATQEEQLLQLAYNSVRKRVATALAELSAQEQGTIRMFRKHLSAPWPNSKTRD